MAWNLNIRVRAQRGLVLYLSGLLLRTVQRRPYCHTYTTAGFLHSFFRSMPALLENTGVISIIYILLYYLYLFKFV